MLNPKSLLIFDWDGTLMDSTATIAQALQQAFRTVGIANPSLAECKQVIGLGLQEALQQIAPTQSIADYQAVASNYRQLYAQKDEHICLFEGALEGIQALSQTHTLAIATGKSRRGLNIALASSGLATYFTITRCADESFSKPHPQMLYEILNYTGESPSNAVMIGDTSHDMQLATNAGMDKIAVSYGAHSAAELQAFAPLFVADTFNQITEWASVPQRAGVQA